MEQNRPPMQGGSYHPLLPNQSQVYHDLNPLKIILKILLYSLCRSPKGKWRGSQALKISGPQPLKIRGPI